MDFHEISSLNLAGRILSRDDLLLWILSGLKNKDSQDWEISMYQFLQAWLDENDFVIVKTSGSTGTPKPIKILKQQMVNSAIKTGKYLNLKKGDKGLLCLPADYIAGKMMLVRALVLGLNLTAAAPSSNPLKHFKEDFDFSAMVPLQVHEILKSPEGTEKLNRIDKLIIGGGPVPEQLREKIRRLKNKTFSTYGMTETVTHIAMELLNGPNADGWLQLLPGVHISTDENGRLIIEAPGVASAPVITNDLAEIGKDGRFRILGRFDNLIISGGINMIPEMTEQKTGHLFEQKFAITSLPDERLGEMPVLVIEGDEWNQEQQENLVEKMAAILKPFEKPRKIIFIEKLPETANHKIDRKALNRLIRNL